jgi:hypothetical protein
MSSASRVLRSESVEAGGLLIGFAAQGFEGPSMKSIIEAEARDAEAWKGSSRSWPSWLRRTRGEDFQAARQRSARSNPSYFTPPAMKTTGKPPGWSVGQPTGRYSLASRKPSGTLGGWFKV